MKCPACGSERSAVRETRRADGDLHRRRVCRDCPAQWWTAEVTLSEVGTRAEEPAWWTQARSLRRQKLPKRVIARELGKGESTVRRALSPKARAEDVERQKQERAGDGGRLMQRVWKQESRKRHAPQD